jgi:hypothetical protein
MTDEEIISREFKRILRSSVIAFCVLFALAALGAPWVKAFVSAAVTGALHVANIGRFVLEVGAVTLFLVAVAVWNNFLPVNALKSIMEAGLHW